MTKTKKKKNYRNKDDIPLYLTAKDVSEILGISRSLTYKLLKKPDFPAVVIGERKIMIPRDKFLAWVEAKMS